jgi:hypothetical protein
MGSLTVALLFTFVHFDRGGPNVEIPAICLHCREGQTNRRRRGGRESPPGGVNAAIRRTSSLVGPSCDLRLFAGTLADPVTEIRNLIGEVGSSFFTAAGCN